MKEFFHMGGYAFYVWTSFGLAFVILLWNLILPFKREKELKTRLKRKFRQTPST